MPMDWTSENLKLLRYHLQQTQLEFATRLGLRRLQTISDWERGVSSPNGVTRRLLDIIANDAGFTDRVAAKLREKLKREEGE